MPSSIPLFSRLPLFLETFPPQVRGPSSRSTLSFFVGLLYFLRNEHPSVNLAFPPVGWHSTVEQPAQMTTVWACEKTVVMVKQPGHLTSMKKERGAGTRVYGIRNIMLADFV